VKNLKTQKEIGVQSDVERVENEIQIKDTANPTFAFDETRLAFSYHQSNFLRTN
jgi:hypothetical protein